PNTVLEGLLHGIPMVAIPIALDQPAIAARLGRLHLAEVISLESISPEKIRKALEKLFGVPEYREAAQRISGTLRLFDGAERAADIIEAKLAKHKGSFHRDATLSLLS
ncbi:MAG: glycosyltransferase, partial [Bryobacteraceae bacterium]